MRFHYPDVLKKPQNFINPQNDLFLQNIRKKIVCLGAVAIAAGIFFAFLLVFSGYFGRVNNRILSEVIRITTCQYANYEVEPVCYSDHTQLKTILENLEIMKQSTAVIKQYGEKKFKEEIAELEHAITQCELNYNHINDITLQRGYTDEDALLHTYFSNDQELFAACEKINTPVLEENGRFNFIVELRNTDEAFRLYTQHVVSGVATPKQAENIANHYSRVVETMRRSFATNRHADRVLEIVIQKQSLLRQMIAFDQILMNVRNNNEQTCLSIIATCAALGNKVEDGIVKEHGIVIFSILFLIIVSTCFLIFLTRYLSSSMVASIKVFNDLWVAKATGEAKDFFLSNISHELRTPMNAVLGIDEIILRETHEPATKENALYIQSAGKTFLNLINDILDMSKLDAGKLAIIPSDYNICATVSELEALLTVRANDKHLGFTVQVNENMPYHLYGDENRIRQCILNLLTNAVKYTEQGSVLLDIDYTMLSESSIALQVSVVDTGIGIRKDDLAKIATPFERFNEKKSKNIEGTGLGLSIVTKLLALMGSKLDVKSEYGKGSTFSFVVEQRVSDWEPVGDYQKKYEEIKQTQTQYRAKLYAPEARILIVDDMDLNLRVAAGLLKFTGIHIDTALSGSAAIDMINQQHYDAIFLDYRMPVMDGVETLHAIHHLQSFIEQPVPIIALTANAVTGAREMFLSEGFTDYLSKPIEGEKFEALLLHYLPPRVLQSVANEQAVVGNPTDEQQPVIVQSQHEKNTIPGINYENALKYCLDDSIFKNALAVFYNTIETQSNLIESASNRLDWHTFTIHVHALKSAARTVGADTLSDMAAHLEQCGAEENVGEITQKLPELLTMYRGYRQKLAAVCKDEGEE